MSFTQDVKHEIASVELKDCCQRAECAALIQLCSSLLIRDQALQLSIKTENATTAKRIFKLLKDRYNPEMNLSAMKKTNLRKNNIYVLEISTLVKDILIDLGLWNDKGFTPFPGKSIVRKECCARAYLAGAFLAAGSINSPQKSNYHLEIVTQNTEHADYIRALMDRFELNAKYIMRRTQHVVYLKASEKISDFLRMVQANNAVLDFEEIRIQRDFHNSLTRLDNCEIANEMKTMVASKEQIELIEELMENGEFDQLDHKTREMAELRMDYPEASLNELCEAYAERTGIIISKSGMKHRLAKLMTYKK